jgi:hypothetical protein
MAIIETPLNLVRGPARNPGWAQLIRLGGDRVAILFDVLRKSVGRIDGVVERLHYSASDGCWVVQYRVGGLGLFAARISPGLLEAVIDLNRREVECLLQARKLSGGVRDAIRIGTSAAGSGSVRFPLKNRCAVRAFANLARAKSSLTSNTRKGNS